MTGWTVNIVMTYALNIHEFLEEETRTFTAVASGDFDTRVPATPTG